MAVADFVESAFAVAVTEIVGGFGITAGAGVQPTARYRSTTHAVGQLSS